MRVSFLNRIKPNARALRECCKLGQPPAANGQRFPRASKPAGVKNRPRGGCGARLPQAFLGTFRRSGRAGGRSRWRKTRTGSLRTQVEASVERDGAPPETLRKRSRDGNWGASARRRTEGIRTRFENAGQADLAKTTWAEPFALDPPGLEEADGDGAIPAKPCEIAVGRSAGLGLELRTARKLGRATGGSGSVEGRPVAP